MRLIIIAAVTGILSLPSAAVAQWNTNCSTYGNQTNCQTNNPQSQASTPWDTLNAARRNDSTGDLLRAAEIGRQRRAQSEAVIAQQNQDMRIANMRIHAGTLIKAGKCDEALAYMLDNGELEMAGEVKALCAR